MKKIFAIVLVLCAFTLVLDAADFSKYHKETIDATYVGETEDGQFEFNTENGKAIFFDQVSNDVEIDLYDDENKDKEFSITWEEEEEELLDEEGEPTGGMRIIKTITGLDELI